MTKTSDFPHLRRKQTLPGTFSSEEVSCTLCKVGPYSVTKLCQLYLRHREYSSCSRLCCLRSWQQKQPFQLLAPPRPWQQAAAGQRAQRWQPNEVPHPDSRRRFITLVKRRGNILVTLTENVLPPYKAITCESAQAAMEQTSWAWPSLPCTHCF